MDKINEYSTMIRYIVLRQSKWMFQFFDERKIEDKKKKNSSSNVPKLLTFQNSEKNVCKLFTNIPGPLKIMK